ncbi:hypothetical protein HID58_022121 [Brassica napus]|uniref:Secreted protein n=1 Tax=Brassica napus TaxID=3708 RepID=A0ABQ8CZW3_BRANA|nr:hypothetical protein HID58_022121 [Brassica napus]
MSWVHAPSVALPVAVAIRVIRGPATTGRKGRDNGFDGHSLHQLPLNGNHTRCFFLHLTLRNEKKMNTKEETTQRGGGEVMVMVVCLNPLRQRTSLRDREMRIE